MIGCDIDGVLTTGFRPEEPDYVVISGRKTDDWPNTLKQLGHDRRIYLRPGQAREIRRICPACVLVMVKDGKITETLG